MSEVKSLYWGGEHNRCRITTPQGEEILLTVPLCKHTDDISYMHRWQHQHWMALVSAYGKTPYFDYYRPYIAPLYRTQYPTMEALNGEIARIVQALLINEMPSARASHPINQTTQPIHAPHLLDLLFEYGPETEKYIK